MVSWRFTGLIFVSQNSLHPWRRNLIPSASCINIDTILRLKGPKEYKIHFYKVFEHSCVAAVCENNLPLIVKNPLTHFLEFPKIINSLSTWGVLDYDEIVGECPAHLWCSLPVSRQSKSMHHIFFYKRALAFCKALLPKLPLSLPVFTNAAFTCYQNDRE